MTKQGKKEMIWKRSGTNQASIVKSGIEGANYYEGEEKKEASKRDNETSDGNPRRLAIYLFRRAPRFPFMTTVKFTPRVNNELNPFFSSFQQATNPCMYITCTYIYIYTFKRIFGPALCPAFSRHAGYNGRWPIEWPRRNSADQPRLMGKKTVL